MGSLSLSDSIDPNSSGSPSANDFFESWDDDIERAARHYCRTSVAEADDVAQEIRLRLLQAWLMHGGPPLVGYVRRTIRNTALNVIRDADRAARSELRGKLPPDVPCDSAGAEVLALLAERLDQIETFMQSLPPHLKQIYELLYIAGVTQRAAAKEMEVSQPRIAQLHRALLERRWEDLGTL